MAESGPRTAPYSFFRGVIFKGDEYTVHWLIMKQYIEQDYAGGEEIQAAIFLDVVCKPARFFRFVTGESAALIDRCIWIPHLKNNLPAFVTGQRGVIYIQNGIYAEIL